MIPKKQTSLLLQRVHLVKDWVGKNSGLEKRHQRS